MLQNMSNEMHLPRETKRTPHYWSRKHTATAATQAVYRKVI